MRQSDPATQNSQYLESADQALTAAISQANAPFGASTEISDLTKRRDFAAAVANRMVERALWLVNLENSQAHVSEGTRKQLQSETTDMLLEWAYELGDDSFRAGDFSSRTGAAGTERFPKQ